MNSIYPIVSYIRIPYILGSLENLNITNANIYHFEHIEHTVWLEWSNIELSSLISDFGYVGREFRSRTIRYFFEIYTKL